MDVSSNPKKHKKTQKKRQFLFFSKVLKREREREREREEREREERRERRGEERKKNVVPLLLGVFSQFKFILHAGEVISEIFRRETVLDFLDLFDLFDFLLLFLVGVESPRRGREVVQLFDAQGV